MSVESIKSFFEETGAGLHYSGVIFENDVINGVIIKSLQGIELTNETVLKVGVNDFIPAIYEGYFPENPIIDEKTVAELIISYLRTSGNVNYHLCNRYFKVSK